jgi:hypothetical protein
MMNHVTKFLVQRGSQVQAADFILIVGSIVVL